MSATDSFGEEFREIASCGGKIELLKQGERVAMQITGTGGLSCVQMGISLDGDRTIIRDEFKKYIIN
jgi:hypothetical protein